MPALRVEAPTRAALDERDGEWPCVFPDLQHNLRIPRLHQRMCLFVSLHETRPTCPIRHRVARVDEGLRLRPEDLQQGCCVVVLRRINQRLHAFLWRRKALLPGGGSNGNSNRAHEHKAYNEHHHQAPAPDRCEVGKISGASHTSSYPPQGSFDGSIGNRRVFREALMVDALLMQHAS